MTEPTFKPDLERLAEAFDNNSAETALQYFLDRLTGRVLVVDVDLLQALRDADGSTTVDADLADEAAEAWPVVKDTEDRFQEVVGEGSPPVFDNMREFAGTVATPGLRAALEHALSERRPFRRFRDALGDDPAELERWHTYRDEQRLDRVRQWLRNEGLPDA